MFVWSALRLRVEKKKDLLVVGLGTASECKVYNAAFSSIFIFCWCIRQCVLEDAFTRRLSNRFSLANECDAFIQFFGGAFANAYAPCQTGSIIKESRLAVSFRVNNQRLGAANEVRQTLPAE
jgi:hypothetical protein